MNITQLEIDFNITGRKIFENVILFEVKQGLEKKVLKNHINSNLSQEQLKLISKKVKDY